jgi:hypothetical protein
MAVKFALLVLLTIAVLWALRFLGIVTMRGQVQRPGRVQPGRQRPVVEETQRCRACGTYVTVMAPRACGRATCPYAPQA